MRSVADRLREEGLRRAQAMHPEDRLDLALRLGDDDVALFAASRGISQAQARQDLIRRRQAGRRASASKGR